MSLQAIIMAGGEGARLRPLTVHMPKPLVPLLGEPVMGYAVKQLKKHDIRDIGVTLWYQPQKIRKAFGRGEKYQVKLKYFEEKEPLGTAGSVRLAQRELDQTFFVLSGDGLTDFDLDEALRFHKAKGAMATLVLKRVEMPLPYGVVMCDQESRITRFIEKPTWSRVFSDLVNTGAYILEKDIFGYIPDTGMPDFGKDVFPALLSGGLPVYGYETKGYWCDVGDLRTYLQAQKDLLMDRVDLPHAWGIHESARIHPTARILGRCLVGAGASVGAGAVVSNSVIGEGCVLAPGAAVENSCLWQGAQAMEKARISGSVLCDGAAARQGADIADGCALGKKAIAGAYSLLRPGVRIWPHVKIAPGSVVSHSVTGGDWSKPQWSPAGAECDSAENACCLCGAFVQAAGIRSALISHCGGGESLAVIASGALSAAGVSVWNAGELPQPMAQTLIRALRLDGGIFAEGNSLRFFQKQGLPLTAKRQSAMDACVLRQEMPPCFVSPGPIAPFSGAEAVYLSAVEPDIKHKPLFSPLAVFCDSSKIRKLAEEGLKRVSARDVRFAAVKDAQTREGETGFLISGDGMELSLFAGNRIFKPEERDLLLLRLFRDRTGRLYDLEGIPRAAEQLGALSAPDGSDDCALQQSIQRDGLAALLWIAEAMKEGPLDVLMSALPETHIQAAEVPCGIGDKGRILHTLCDQVTLPYTLGNGIRIAHEGGCATVVPDDLRGAVRIISEAGTSEFAQELCDFYTTRIQNIAKEKKQTALSP